MAEKELTETYKNSTAPDDSELQQMEQQIVEKTRQAELRWQQMFNNSKIPSGEEGDAVRKELEEQMKIEQVQLSYKFSQLQLELHQKEMEKERIKKKRNFEEYQEKLKKLESPKTFSGFFSAFDYGNSCSRQFDQPSDNGGGNMDRNLLPVQGPQPRQSNPLIANIIPNVQVRIYKGNRREDEVDFVPGPDIVDWFQSVDTFFSIHKITDDAVRIGWLPAFTDPSSGNAMMVIRNITEAMKQMTYEDVKSYLIGMFAGETENFIELSTQLIGNHPVIHDITEVPAIVLVLRRHLTRVVKSYVNLPRFRTKHPGQEDELLEFAFIMMSSALFPRHSVETVLFEPSPPGMPENLLDLSIKFDKHIMENSTTDELNRRWKEHHNHDEVFLNARSTLGVPDTRKKGKSEQRDAANNFEGNKTRHRRK